MTEREKIDLLTNLEFAAEGLYNSWQTYTSICKSYHDKYVETIEEIRKIELTEPTDHD